jgi:hypothetical protein
MSSPLKPLRITYLGLAIGSLCYAISCGSPQPQRATLHEAWNPSNDPLRLSRNYIRQLSQLPRRGELATQPWTDSYWPSFEAGVAARWNQPQSRPFQYKSPSLEKLKAMSESQLSELSPAEKFDIFRGRYDYPLVKSERQRTSPDAQSWEGICHGWAPAAYLYQEPQPMEIQNKDGIKIPFGSSDVKALLSYYTGQISRSESRMLGSRCNVDLKTNPGAASDPACRDTNAGSFHVVLTNQIGIQKQSFVADVTRDLQVWNQPIYGYNTEFLQSRGPSFGAAPGTVKEIQVKTQMLYTVEVEPHWQALNGTNGSGAFRETYVYWLELDQSENIIGGTWESDTRPDFLWTQKGEPFTGEFKDLELIYQGSIKSSPSPSPTVLATPVVTITPIPTILPTPTVTVIPTTLPTPEPTVLPSPSPTFGPLPNEEDLQCPSGYQVGYTLEKSAYCTNGSEVLGPFPETLIQKCLERFYEFCNQAKWPQREALSLRGNQICLRGTRLDTQSGFCMEEASLMAPAQLYGPFTGNLLTKCRTYGGGMACERMRWDREFTLKLMAQE